MMAKSAGSEGKRKSNDVIYTHGGKQLKVYCERVKRDLGFDNHTT